MARTDKDRPYWVRVYDPDTDIRIRILHSCHCASLRGESGCDVNDVPNSPSEYLNKTCRYWTTAGWWYGKPYEGEVRLRAHKARQMSRQELLLAAKTYNADNEPEALDDFLFEDPYGPRFHGWSK